MRVVHAVDPCGFKPPSRRNAREGRLKLPRGGHTAAMPSRDATW